MTGNKKRILYMLLGLSAGITAFAVTGLISAAGVSSYLILSLTQGAALGFVFGFSFGFADGIIYKEARRGLLKAGTAALIGAATAAGAQILAVQGMLWTSDLLKLEWNQSIKIILPLWKGLGWMLTGTAIGAVDGIHQRTLRRSIAGILGGLVGGLLGGLGLEFLTAFIPQAAFARSSGLVLMGLMIGVFLGEFERRFSFARLRILTGELRDREYLLIKNKTGIGSGTHEDISLQGYLNTTRCQITKESGDVFLIPETENLILLNDKSFTGRQPLKYYDVIQNGNMKLLYLSL